MNEKDRIYKKVETVIRDDGNKSSYIGEDDFVTLIKGGININFHIKNPNLDMENIFRAVKRAKRIIKDRFDYDLHKIDIDIYKSMDEMRQDGRSRSMYASWIAGIYDGKIRVISENDDEDTESLYIILTHEIVHLAINEMSKCRCPYWLDEGLAVSMSQEVPDEYSKKLISAMREDKVLPLEALEGSLPADIEDDLRQLGYAQVASTADYFIETYGWDDIKSVINQCGRRHFSAILNDLSLNYYLVQKGWERWYKNKSA